MKRSGRSFPGHRKRGRGPSRKSVPLPENQIAPGDRWVGRCPDCGKARYTTRSNAKKAAKSLFPWDAFSVYICGDYYHYGHNYRKGVQ